MRRWLATTIVVVLSASGLAMSCGGGGSAPTNDSACQAYVNALCGDLQSCYPAQLSLAYGTVDACKARVTLSCKAAITAPSTGLTPTYVSNCAAAQTGAACSALYQDSPPAACAPVTGTLGNGVACFDGAQCQSGFCPADATTGCGTCTAAPAAGGACVKGSCPSGLTCNSSSQCQKRASAGQACTVRTDCEYDLSCNAGKCGTPAKAGEACSLDGKSGPECDSIGSLFCNTSTKKCESFKVATAGSTCGLDATAGSFTTCDSTSYCQTVDATKFTGKCVARSADGATCKADGLLGGNSCTPPAQCLSGTCKTPDPTACK